MGIGVPKGVRRFRHIVMEKPQKGPAEGARSQDESVGSRPSMTRRGRTSGGV